MLNLSQSISLLLNLQNHKIAFQNSSGAADSVTEIAYTDNKCLQCAKYEIRVGELEEALSKTSPLTQADKIIGENGSTSDVSSEDDVLDFEFRLDWKTMQKHMTERYAAGRCLEVWLSGKLDRNTGKIISIQTGRRTERRTFAREEVMT